MPAPPTTLNPASAPSGAWHQRFVRTTDAPDVAVLCVAGNSIYHRMGSVDCYDITRDVRTFEGGVPVVAHPPCRSWSAYCAHQSKPLPGEKELGPLCVEHLKRCGGILEHPAHSRLFAHCDLPRPGDLPRPDGLWTVEVLQAWWGDSRTKKTWLCFSSISPREVKIPYRAHNARGDRRRWQVMSKHQRSATNLAMAEWLIATARKAKRLPSSGANNQGVERRDECPNSPPTSSPFHPPFC